MKLHAKIKQIQHQKVRADELINKTNVKLGRLRLQVDELTVNQADSPAKETRPMVLEYMDYQPSLTAAKAIDDLKVGRLSPVCEEVSCFHVLFAV